MMVAEVSNTPLDKSLILTMPQEYQALETIRKT